MSAPPFPTPQAPPPPSPTTIPNVQDAAAQMSRLLAVLGDFTNHVSDMASVTIQRDNAKKQLAKKEAEYNKWRKQHASFPPLAEQQEKEKASAKIEFEELDRKLKQHVGSRDKLAQAIAMSVVSNRTSVGEDTKRMQLLEKEIQFTKSEVNGMKTKLHQASAEYGQIRSIHSSHGLFQNQIGELNHRLDNMMAGLNSRPSIGSTPDNSNIDAEKEISKLEEKLLMVQERVDDIPNLKLDISKSKQEIRDLTSLVNGQENSLQELRGTILGEKDDKGLLEIIATVEEDVDKLRHALESNGEDLDSFQSELNKFSSRFTVLERASSRKQTPQPGIGTAKFDDTELRSGLESIKDEVADLQNSLVALRREQEEKDDIVGDEMDGFKASTSKLDDAVRTNRNDMEAAISRINSSISALQARSSTPTVTSNPPTPQPFANGAWKPDDAVGKKIQETLKQHRQVLERQREAISLLEMAFQNLDGRFNTLTTDQLAQNMVQQMSEIYPYTANVQIEFDNAKRRDDQLQRVVQELAGKVENASQMASEAQASNAQTSEPSKTRLVNLQQQIDKLSVDIKTIRNNAKSDFTFIVDRINAIDSVVNTTLPPPNEGFETLKRDVNALSSHVEDMRTTTVTELGSLAVQVEKLNEHCGIVPMENALAEYSVANDKGAPDPSFAVAVAAAGIAANNGDYELVEDEDTLPTGMRRKYLLKRKKRKRNEGEESEYDGSAQKTVAMSPR